MIPIIAIRTLSLEKVRSDLNVILLAIYAERFKIQYFCTLAKMQIFPAVTYYTPIFAYHMKKCFFAFLFPLFLSCLHTLYHLFERKGKL